MGSLFSYCPIHNNPSATPKYLATVMSFSLSGLYIIASIIADKESSCNYPINIIPKDNAANEDSSHVSPGSVKIGTKSSNRSYF